MSAIYNNPLHPPIPSTFQSPFNALSGAVVCSANAPPFVSPFRRRLPQIPYTPSSKWRNVTGRTNLVHSPVHFDYLGYTRQGVPMRELSTRGAHALSSMIVGATDQVFVHTGLSRITLYIIWPGYEHVDWRRSIEIMVNGPMTRAQLGAVVASNFARFIEMTRNERSTCSDYKIGTSGILFEHLVLVGLHNVFEDAWQADVAVDRR
ncbi:uncharacterized protein LACBIDRAFT_321426 [Laccaria bicolor S238N-H82]|uniref:Predicted protein n=1 Tax=Laccaria bicolor (strain S238N-H82 / ATCC MYA-4686) TaxID=486041 RepID=B0CQB9_LACBS|nr:uncharacterized protein LACBIDRAFT_321426 [Laccaria bicolor S238N-H82]EDR16178.1 predicted protein [Laccaria bicolor S238N-H82]|eukprot:XP_001874386.1 predicted protein [Laccaria bicolor S238N-H82]